MCQILKWRPITESANRNAIISFMLIACREMLYVSIVQGTIYCGWDYSVPTY